MEHQPVSFIPLTEEYVKKVSNKWVIQTGCMSPPVYRAVLHDKYGHEVYWLEWKHSPDEAEALVPEDGRIVLRD